jgi:hypothetical protein
MDLDDDALNDAVRRAHEHARAHGCRCEPHFEVADVPGLGVAVRLLHDWPCPVDLSPARFEP